MKTKRNVYTKEDYNSNDGMLTTVWGPSMWHYLHVMSFNYPTDPTEEDKKHYKSFMINLKYTLPCKYCRINLIKNYKEMPITKETMESRYSFSKYVYHLHEKINKILNKKSHLTYDQVRERYEHFRARCVIEKKIKTKKRKEKGCTEPLYGKKSKCVLKIIPQEKKEDSFQIDKLCIKKRI